MNDFGQNIRDIVSKGMEAIGNTASNIASTTRQKVNELNTEARKKELYEALGEQTYIAWLNGEEFPDAMTVLLRELLRVDRQSRTDGEGSTQEAAEAPIPEASSEPEPPAEPEEPEVPVSGAAESADIPVIEIPEAEKPEKANEPLSSAINSLFENMPPVDQLADKVNASLDEMGEQLKKFSDSFGKQLNDMTDELFGKSDRKDD